MDKMDWDRIKKLREKVALFESLDQRFSKDLQKIAKILMPQWDKMVSSGTLASDLVPPDLASADLMDQIHEAKLDVKRMLAKYVGIKITDPELATKIMRIRDNTHYTIDEYCKTLEAGEKVTEEMISQELDEEFDWMEALFAEGTADYVDINFFRRRDQIGTIVVSQSLPPRFRQNLEILQEAYALGLFETTLVFCRSLIEVGVFEALKRRGKLRTTKNVAYMDHYKLSALLHQVRSHVKDLDNLDRAEEVRKKANQVLHWKEVVTVGEKDALEAVRTTFQLLEQLFGLESF